MQSQTKDTQEINAQVENEKGRIKSLAKTEPKRNDKKIESHLLRRFIFPFRPVRVFYRSYKKIEREKCGKTLSQRHRWMLC